MANTTQQQITKLLNAVEELQSAYNDKPYAFELIVSEQDLNEAEEIMLNTASDVRCSAQTL